VATASRTNRLLVFYTSLALETRARLAHAVQLDANLEVLNEADVSIPTGSNRPNEPNAADLPQIPDHRNLRYPSTATPERVALS
jgi:hypothetical protein